MDSKKSARRTSVTQRLGSPVQSPPISTSVTKATPSIVGSVVQSSPLSSSVTTHVNSADQHTDGVATASPSAISFGTREPIEVSKVSRLSESIRSAGQSFVPEFIPSSFTPSTFMGEVNPSSLAVSPSLHSVDVHNPDPEVVKTVGRHLVDTQPQELPTDETNGSESFAPSSAIEDQFTDLRLQGGDITRQLYNWQRTHEAENGSTRQRRARSVSPKPQADLVEHHAQELRVPGAFRRDFIASRNRALSADPEASPQPSEFLTKNFIEFLTLYGHFAGEELEDIEDDYSAVEDYTTDHAATADEQTALLSPQRHVRPKSSGGKPSSSGKAILLLLKSFVGTGVLFLPRAYLNGGLLFSSVTLLFVAVISYYCMILLVKARAAVTVSSYGDIGGVLYGKYMRLMILFSIIISQIGFASAYIVFTSENLQAFIKAVTTNHVEIPLIKLILIQFVIFTPLAMIRNISKLSGTALVADFFILLGLLYLFYYSGYILLTDGIADVVMFNKSGWTLFIGTAIFTFEGIGLIIPIQESMKYPEKFPSVLLLVMAIITVVFVGMGAVCYAAFGSSVQTVVLLNFPQDNAFVNGVQLLYSAAILLSTPLQLFPAIRIMENGLFVRSGKYNHYIKWQKNLFRFGVVILTTLVAWGGADDLDRFVAIVGSFACIPLVYIYPPLLHFKSTPGPLNVVKFFDIILFFAGLMAMGCTTALTLQSWAAGE
ncbi:hypothetical protein CANCADRAFT_30857 [Tortispora caseinolytica NRRL Y-17796]|uniref:Amino acid transporter transmembrane domain-containing protein n=1 Tax=Tortispora caseinolytica NRRL Y-17796 TaxID=767744 RepID=A0A1E4TM34_9ASCO|nr:hypothetical protein CANCADRAFT_30857 [Tortispora caseinolytica NRRL Y-17796]